MGEVEKVVKVEKVEKPLDAWSRFIFSTFQLVNLFDFLAFHGLNAKIILSRKEGDNRNDAELKTAKLKRLFNLKQFQSMEKIMFDDNENVRKELEKIGIKTFDQNTLKLK